jgi:hypothetical protein
MAQIEGHVAFYPNQVEIQEVGEADDSAAVREVVEHTDDGAGRSQLEPWPATADQPRNT